MERVSYKSRYLNSLKVGEIQAKWSANGQRILGYSMDLWQRELGLHKQVSAPAIYLLEIKVGELLDRWDKQTDEHHRRSKLAASKEACDQMTVEAGARLSSLSKILEWTLSRNDQVDWERLKDRSLYAGPMSYSVSAPKEKLIPQPTMFEPYISFWDKIFGRRARKLEQARALYDSDLDRWRKQTEEATALHDAALKAWREAKEKFEEECNRQRDEFLAAQAA